MTTLTFAQCAVDNTDYAPHMFPASGTQIPMELGNYQADYYNIGWYPAILATSAGVPAVGDVRLGTVYTDSFTHSLTGTLNATGGGGTRSHETNPLGTKGGAK